MKWVDLINSNLKYSEIRKLMLENKDIKSLIKNIRYYNDNIKKQ